MEGGVTAVTMSSFTSVVTQFGLFSEGFVSGVGIWIRRAAVNTIHWEKPDCPEAKRYYCVPWEMNAVAAARLYFESRWRSAVAAFVFEMWDDLTGLQIKHSSCYLWQKHTRLTPLFSDQRWWNAGSEMCICGRWTFMLCMWGKITLLSSVHIHNLLMRVDMRKTRRFFCFIPANQQN